MLNLKNFKLVRELKNLKPQFGWLSFSATRKKSQNELLESLISENKFIKEEIKIRQMVENMLQQEFGAKIKEIKNYDFLVDSVVNKLKNKQLGSIEPIDNN